MTHYGSTLGAADSTTVHTLDRTDGHTQGLAGYLRMSFLGDNDVRPSLAATQPTEVAGKPKFSHPNRTSLRPSLPSRPR